MGRKWLLRAENKQNSEIFTWNSIFKNALKRAFFLNIKKYSNLDFVDCFPLLDN